MIANLICLQVIELNVGGMLYTTTRSTLTKFPDSMLGRMFGGDTQPSHLDSQGRQELSIMTVMCADLLSQACNVM